jgi:hypothetical protein
MEGPAEKRTFIRVDWCSSPHPAWRGLPLIAAVPGLPDVERGRESTIDIVEAVQGKAVLLQVIGTLRPSRGFADFLDSGQEQANQDGDNRNHDEQLNECEAIAASTSDAH